MPFLLIFVSSFYLHILHLFVLTLLISSGLLSLSICRPAAVSCKCCWLLLYFCGIDVGLDQQTPFVLTGFRALWVCCHVYFIISDHSPFIQTKVSRRRGWGEGRWVYCRGGWFFSSSSSNLIQTPNPKTQNKTELI